MLTQTVTITQNSTPNIIIGRRGTYETEQVVFDVSWLIDTYGAGSAVLMVHRPTDQTAYPVEAVLDGNTLTWTVSETDTQYRGHGECEIFWYVNGGLAKSCICCVTILRDIGETTETAPDPYETWVETLTRLGAETLTNAQAAEQSANSAAQSASEAENSAAAALESEENALDSENAAKASEQAAAASAHGAEQSASAARQSATEAAQSASAAESSEANAQESADNASASADRAEQAAASIEGDTERAEAAARTAQGAASDASGFAGTASIKATEAAGSAATAEQAANTATQKAADASASATAAAGSASSASASATAAGNAQTAAETAQGKAEDAQEAAETAAQSIEDSAAQIDTNTADILNLKSALKSALNTKAGIIRDTASGSVASFAPDATVPNLLGLDVALEPIQDLHGYDSPWPAGGGVNLLDPDAVTDGVRTTNTGELTTANYAFVSDFIPITANADYYCNAVISSAYGYAFCFYDQNKAFLRYKVISGGGAGVANSGADAAYMRITGMLDTKSTTIIAQSSSAVPYSPYSNICPISGRDSVEVGNVGKNKFDINAQESYSRSATWYLTNNGDGSITVSLDSNTSIGNKKLKELCLGLTVGEIYTLSAKTTGSNDYIYLYGVNETWRFGSAKRITEAALNSTVLWYASGARTSATISDIQIELGSTAHDYHPYAGTTYTIQLGETVYGGTLDVTQGTLTVDRANIASYNGETLPGEWISDRDVYSAGATPTIGAQVVYELATPITIQLDPVQIATIAGQTNNVWADAGDVTVEYAADLKTYIDNKIAAAVAAMS